MPGFKPATKAILKAPEVLEPVRSSEIEASPIGKIKGMFESVQPVFAPKKVKKVKKTPLEKIPVKNVKEEKNDYIDSKDIETKNDIETKEEVDFDTDLKEIKELIIDEEKGIKDGKDTFYEPLPKKGFVPSTRRGFSSFIKQTYSSFMLDPTTTADPDQEKYPYQRFIREYMRNESPYRGILTYHGLGSGKTCTAIAASEALYSRGNKKIIVMTPFSLRKNFLKEVSLCGFRHYRLNNFWTAMPVGDADAHLFATAVLGVPGSHLRTAKSIWIPDFRKEPNYKELSADEQTEIRKQILSILVWDKTKNPNGRIRFINYNGISAKKLKEIACSGEGFFNDSVIIIDEIHNIVRLMQGTIDPYLVNLPGKKRLISKEEVTVDTWKPSLCANAGKNYMRGYLFYRLLLDAKNSKIIGLSGTPLINFPEELGILMNVLHGYIPTISFLVQEVGAEAQKRLHGHLTMNPYIDFVSIINDSGGRGSNVRVTMLPYGIKKLDEGVERVDSYPTVNEIIESIQDILVESKFTLSGKITTAALPLLPPFGEQFRDAFIKGDTINNKIVLVKRLTGLISYYKGSRADLMPRIKSDTVVRVPMSVFSQKGYIEARNDEISKEKGKKATGEMGGVWTEVYEIDSGKQSSNYKMASRQACNFVFPSDVIRPKPRTKKEALEESDNGNKLGDILDAAPDSINPRDAEGFPELEDEKDFADETVEAIAEQDRLIAEEIDAEPPALQEGGDLSGADLSGADLSGADLSGADLSGAAAPAKKFSIKPSALKAAIDAKAVTQKGECKSGVDEPYSEATARAKECLRTIAKYSLKLGGENGLETHSPKFAKMLKNIQAIPGSNLVYSQFLDMEGIGIFRLAMDANGYAPIEIVNGPTGPTFTKGTLESLAKGPAGQSRYMTFSGGEEEDVRRLYLNIFNANFDEVPQNIKSVLEQYKYVNNHKGEIAKVFCITSAGAEGLSLKCVRGVHIMEPYWNDVRLKQVKGRAIRIGSHLELPEAERDVTIYTYLTCFSEEAQVSKVGDKRIDETIRQADAVDRDTALKLKLPIPEGAQYVLTTDERIYEIAERKKTIINALENVMKSSAVDCALSYKENKDGTFQCLALDGAVGDFLYDPDLSIDIRESASKFAVKEEPLKPAAPKVVDYVKKAFKGVVYRMKDVKKDGVLVGFEMWEDADGGKLLGTAGAKDGKPAPPVKML